MMCGAGKKVLARMMQMAFEVQSVCHDVGMTDGVENAGRQPAPPPRLIPAITCKVTIILLR